MFKLEDTEWIHVELSSKCQAMCPHCARNDYGFKLRTDYPETDITIDQWIRTFDNDLLPNLKHLHFNGNFGDSLMNNDMMDIMDWSLDKWKWDETCFYISTNGGIRNEKWWAEFGKKYKDKVFVFFALDGLEDTHSLYRINVPYEKVLSNAIAFIENGGLASWKMIPFKHNQHQIEECRELAKKYNFINFRLNDAGRDHMWVFTNEEEGYWIKPVDGKIYDDTWKQPNIFSKQILNESGATRWIKKLNDKWDQFDRKIECYVKEQKSFYMCANGEIYPCCWTGHYPKQFTGMYNTYGFFDTIKFDNNNAFEVGLETAFEILNHVEQTFESKKIWGEGNKEVGNCPLKCVDCALKKMEGEYLKRGVEKERKNKINC